MKAMVFCAGYGTRLGTLTRETPKPMLPVHGRPLLENILIHLKQEGVNEVAINLHYRPEVIQNYFLDGTPLGIKITYSYEPQLLGTAGGLRKMASFFKDEPEFLIQYGDIITDQSFKEMINFHRQKRAIATILVHSSQTSNSVVEMDQENRITTFLERPPEALRKTKGISWANSGIGIFSPEIFKHIPIEGPSDLPRDVYTILVKNGSFFGYPLNGYRSAVDSPERLEEVNLAMQEKRCKIIDG